MIINRIRGMTGSGGSCNRLALTLKVRVTTLPLCLISTTIVTI
jgi:hypothetical protein